MSNKVQNKMNSPLPSKKAFNDEDILQDVAISIKHLTTEYGLLIQEASNKKLADKISNISKDLSTLSRDTFNLMFENGWYTLEKTEKTKLSEEYNKFSKKLEEFK